MARRNPLSLGRLAALSGSLAGLSGSLAALPGSLASVPRHLPKAIRRSSGRPGTGRADARSKPIRVAQLAGPLDLAPLDGTRAPWPGKHHQVSGTDLFLRSTPCTAKHSEPALFIHGLGGASTNFTDVADLLSPWFEGEALDLPGFGRSGPSAVGSYSIAAHAAVVIAYLEYSARGPVHLVGNSMGGAISIVVAATRPELVRTLTLISPAVPDLRPKRAEDLVLPLLMLPRIGPWLIRQGDNQSPEQRAREVLEICFAHPERVPQNRLAEAVADVVARRSLPWAHEAFLASLRGIAGSYLSYGGRSPWQSMAQITAPTLVVWGELDRLVDVSRAARVARVIPDATLLVLPDVGHTAQLEDPEMTARAILGLCRRAAPGLHGSGM